MPPGPVTRRGALVLGGAAAAGAALGEPSAEAKRKRPRNVRRYDVVVVGAGLAGLTAADTLRRAGKSVRVLEARKRVGGRNFDVAIPGGVVELGGQWAGPGQDKVLGLARDLGIATFPTYAEGDAIYHAHGANQRYSGDIPPANPVALVEVQLLIDDLNARAASVPLGRPWDTPGAADIDRQSVATYVAGRISTAEGRALAAVAISGVYGEDAALVSFLDLLHSIKGVGGDFNTLIGDAQTIRFTGGPQGLSKGLAKRLGKRVRLGQEVVGVEQSKRRAAVVTRSERLYARQVILTPPRAVLDRLRFAPALPPAHDQLLQRQPMGAVTKVNAVYDEPFWRAAGLSGTVVSDTGPVQIAYDNSPPGGRPGVLVGFFEGGASRRAFGLGAGGRRAQALECFARYFGDRARHPTAFHEMQWASERFTRGAYGAYSPPGVITSIGAAAEGAVGRIHFAGDGTSAEWPGYMDGAIRSGERAAREVLAEL